MARLAIIPARSGSKRIPDKNIKPFFGRSIIAYSIDAARQSGLFDKIHVSTDSVAIAKIAEVQGVAVDFLRPPEISGDLVPLRDVLRYVRDRYLEMGRKFESICRISACAPLLEGTDLVAAECLFTAHGGRHSVTAVTKTVGAHERAFTLSNTGILEPVYPDRMFARSQDLATTYQDAGSFALLAASQLDKEGADYYRDRLGFVMPREKAIDIDEPDDWRMAELIFAGRRSLAQAEGEGPR